MRSSSWIAKTHLMVLMSTLTSRYSCALTTTLALRATPDARDSCQRMLLGSETDRIPSNLQPNQPFNLPSLRESLFSYSLGLSSALASGTTLVSHFTFPSDHNIDLHSNH